MIEGFATAGDAVTDIECQMKEVASQPFDLTSAERFSPRGETGLSGADENGSRNGVRESSRRVEQSIVYMRQNLNRPLQVATLAAMAKISPSHFFALFKRRTGCAPMDYFTRLRMERARRLLDATTLSVKEVAAAMGYEDQFYFSRVFKSVTSLAPTEYRSLHKNGACENGKGPNGNSRSTWSRSTDSRVELTNRKVTKEGLNWLPMENPQSSFRLHGG